MNYNLLNSTFPPSRHTFSAKEKDTETGYSYPSTGSGRRFGARYYDSDLSVWLSVDPLADKYPSMSSYMYTAGNPVMLVDPDGNDWFENEKTGNVYYNSEMKNGQEGTGAMKGEGWKHLGENGMFMADKNDRAHDDQHVLYNSGITPTTSSPRADGSVNMEASIEGDQAKSFMKGQGYDFNPTQQVIFSETFTIPIQGAPRQPSVEIRITEKSSYMKSDSYETGWNYIGSPLFGRTKYSTQFVGRARISYSDNILATGYLKIFNFIYRNSTPVIFDNWSKYPMNVKLINKFIKRYGTQ